MQEEVMDLFIFAGQSQGAGRTTCSVQFAAGACELGRRPLHLQVLPSKCSPVLQGVDAIPFDTAVIPGADPTTIAAHIRRHVEARPSGQPIIVDMPAQPVRDTVAMLVSMDAHVLLPMQSSSKRARAAAKDYRKAVNAWGQASMNRKGPPFVDWRLEISVLPIGWPPCFSDDWEFTAMLVFRELVPLLTKPFTIVRPGIPELDPETLCLNRLEAGDCFTMAPAERSAARELAQAVLEQSVFPY
jgi:hypothetical protein